MVGVVLELGEVPGRDHRLGPDKRRRPHLAVGIGVPVQAVLAERTAERGAESRVHDEHGAGELRPGGDVQDAEFLADLPVRHPLVAGERVRVGTHLADHRVLLGRQPVRTVGRRRVRHPQQDLADFGAQGLDLVGEGVGPVAQVAAPVLQLGGLVAPAFLVQVADLARDALDLVADGVALHAQLPLTLVQFDDPVQRGDILTPSGNGSLDPLRVGTQAAQVDHGMNLPPDGAPCGTRAPAKPALRSGPGRTTAATDRTAPRRRTVRTSRR